MVRQPGAAPSPVSSWLCRPVLPPGAGATVSTLCRLLIGSSLYTRLGGPAFLKASPSWLRRARAVTGEMSAFAVAHGHRAVAGWAGTGLALWTARAEWSEGRCRHARDRYPLTLVSSLRHDLGL